MPRKKDEDDDIITPIEASLEQRVRVWSKYADFRHVATSPCQKCGKGMYQFTSEDEHGFCTFCYNQTHPAAKHKRGWSGLGRNAHKKQKGKNVGQGEEEK